MCVRGYRTISVFLSYRSIRFFRLLTKIMLMSDVPTTVARVSWKSDAFYPPTAAYTRALTLTRSVK